MQHHGASPVVPGRFIGFGSILIALGLLAGCGNSEEVVYHTPPVVEREAARPLQERIRPAAVTEDTLNDWYFQLIVVPADFPQVCRPEGEWRPTAAFHRNFEAHFARMILEELEEDDLDGLAEAMDQARERVGEFLYLKSLEQGVEVTEGEVRAAFEESRDRFSRPETAIFDFFFLGEGESDVVGPVVDTPPADLVALEEMANAGASIQELRREAVLRGIVYSEQRSRAQRGTLPPMLEEAIFSTPEGEHSGVRRTEAGWHLILMRSIQPGQEPDFDRASEVLKSRLQHQKVEALRGKIRQLDMAGEPDDDEAREKAFFQELYTGMEDHVDRLEEMMYNNEVVLAYQRRLSSQDFDITEEDVRKEWEEHRDAFTRRAHYHVLEALVPLQDEDVDTTDPGAEQAARVERRREIMQWLEMLAEEGRGFLELEPGEAGFPLRVVDRESHPQGPRGAMLDLAVEDLEVGAFSMPLPSRQFFHVYQLIGKEDPRPMEFEEARRQVETVLKIERMETEYGRLGCQAMELAKEAEDR
ncbi:MAG: peptidyl-prolyl cis-trans isomerase [Candidatus Sumerlaeia bacterium]|nr:peptidyl-prolyl cis-trans isomerase [Candidatus Sumerlaeia bacterium]